MITLHHLEHSQSSRIIWLLEELGHPYELKIYKRDPVTSLAPAEYKALHPAGTAPIITDGDVTIAETNAIADYLLDKYDSHNRLRPATGSAERVPYLYWFHTALGSMTPLILMMYMNHQMSENAPNPDNKPIIKEATSRLDQFFIHPRLVSLLGYMNEELANKTYLAGEMITAADIVSLFCIDALENRMKAYDFSKEYTNIGRYAKVLRARPAYQKAIEKSGE